MAQQIINNKFSGETGLSSRNKINSNFCFDWRAQPYPTFIYKYLFN